MAEVRRKTWRHSAAAVTLFLGLVNTLSAVTPSVGWRHRLLVFLVPAVVRSGSRLLTAFFGFLLFICSYGLARGKRMAWAITLVLLIILVFLHLLKGLDYEEASLSLALAVFLLWLEPHFRAKSDPPSLRLGLAVVALAVVFNLLYAATGLYLLRHHLNLRLNLPTVLAQAWYLATFNADPALAGRTPLARWFLDTEYLVTAASLLVGVAMLLRPVIYRGEATTEERQRAAEIAGRWGASSLVFFTLCEDKLYHFAESGTAYTAYRQVGAVAVALGDPVGPPQEVPKEIREFTSFAEENGWHPVFYQVLPDYLPDYRGQGLTVLKIGEEAIVDLEGLSLSGQRWKEVRYSVNKARQAGLMVRFYEPPLAPSLLDALEEVSDDWLAVRRGGEKGFSLGWFSRKHLVHLPVATVEDRHGRVWAFANFVPMYNLPQASPDMLRYRRGAPTGTIDLLLVESAFYYRQKGYRVLNLGLAPLASVNAENQEGLTARTVALIYRNVPNLRGLYHFKNKYHPTWEPRYLVYPGAVNLPVVALAVVRAGHPTGLWRYLRR